MVFSKIQEDFIQKTYRRTRSENMLGHVHNSLKMLDRFCQDSYKKDSTSVIKKLKADLQKAQREAKSTKKLYLFLDNFVQWLQEYTPRRKLHLSSSTVINYYSQVLQFLRYNEIPIDSGMLSQFVTLPTKLKELPQPITRDEINILVINSDEKRQALYLVLSSSGIRIGEALQLRKMDFEMLSNPVRVILPARITKSREGRYSFISSEAKEKLVPLLQKLESDDLVFATSDRVMRAELTEEQYFQRLRKITRLDDMESSETKHKITIHKFRKFFATKSERKLGIQVSGALIGHSPYMKTYYEYEPSQLAKLYLELEPDLAISPEFRQKLIIVEQEKEISDLKRNELEIERLSAQQIKDRKSMLEMFSEMTSNPEKLKKLLRELKDED